MRLCYNEKQEDRIGLEIENGILKKYAPEPVCVTVPDGVTEIGEGAFKCGFSEYGDDALIGVVLPDSLRRIGRAAFCGRTRLKEVKIPEGIVEIGKNAFTSCRSLTDITLSTSLKKIKRDAFRDEDDVTVLPTDNLPVTIHAPKGSYAEQYAKKNHFAYKES